MDRLQLKDVRVRYFGSERDALTALHVTLEAGEMLGVAGSNGAGKSTLALVSAGFIPRVVRAQIEGTVEWAGKSLMERSRDGEPPPVGMVFSDPDSQISGARVTVREELAFGLENTGVPRSEMDPMVDGALEILGIAHLAERSPLQLSGGEQQRVAIASILVMRHRAMVLDEPVAQLDPVGAESVGRMLRDLADRGHAIMVTEHDPAVLLLADRCLVLSEGRRVAQEPPAVALSPAVAGPAGIASPVGLAAAQSMGLEPGIGLDHGRLVERILSREPPGGAERRTAETGPVATSTPRWRARREHRPADVRVEHLVHRYPGGVEALRGVDLAIEPGEVVALVGRNGSGKTTLLKHGMGLLRPANGSVRIGGVDLARKPIHEIARTVGLVFQDPSDQLFGRSVEREVAFGPRNLQLDAAAVDHLVAQALSVTGLQTQRDRNPYDLGSAGRKLVALAGVLAMDPAVLLLDEPTTGQDIAGVQRIASVLRMWSDLGRIVIAITHDMAFAAEHFSRIVVMSEGRIVADAAPAALFTPAAVPLLERAGLRLPPSAQLAADLGMTAPYPTRLEDLLRAARPASPS